MPSQEMTDLIELLASAPLVAGRTIEEQRVAMASMLESMPLPDSLEVTEVLAGGVLADWVIMPNSASGRVVLYLHGGAYVVGSKRTHRELAARIALSAGARVLVLDYRLAPEHPFPAAVDDAVAAYRWLRHQGIAANSIAVAGDSAGGGLTLATLLALRDAGDALPACAVCLSPWADLEGNGASALLGGADDPMITIEGLRESANMYAAGALRHPHASPVHGDFRGLPPLLIQVGSREILLDDSTRVAKTAQAAGVDVRLEVEDGAYHVWHAMPHLPESFDALSRIGAFVEKHIRI